MNYDHFVSFFCKSTLFLFIWNIKKKNESILENVERNNLGENIADLSLKSPQKRDKRGKKFRKRDRTSLKSMLDDHSVTTIEITPFYKWRRFKYIIRADSTENGVYLIAIL